MQLILDLIEKGKVPDPMVRLGIKALLLRRLHQLEKTYNEDAFVELLKQSPLVVDADKANEQHYEVPFEFFEKILGKRMKYSACYWPTGILSLDDAEEQSLELASKHAQLADGQEILELGCGWGSLTLWMAQAYPRSTIIAISNSKSQKEFIDAQANIRNVKNVQVYTCDINDLNVGVEFDRIVSIEMFEHLRNYELLLERLAKWLKPDGRAFAHIFSHRQYSYVFETEGPLNWMGRHFFTGGMMPSATLFSKFSQHLEIEQTWPLNGKHYSKTAASWLANLLKYKVQIMPILARTYGEEQQELWFQRWKLFLMACEELFGFRDGSEWEVNHYLLRRRQ